jgi:uncharacterized membrane protein (UPF0127 family)
MLFVFSSLRPHSMTMRNVCFPLDMLWLDETGTVLGTASAAPNRGIIFGGYRPSKYVLELPAATIQDCGVQVGQRVVF